MLLAGHARSEGLVLVTNNTREFFRVKELEVEDWTIWWIQMLQSSSLRLGTRLNSPMLCEIMVIPLDTPWAAI